jgi:hypothetical protein
MRNTRIGSQRKQLPGRWHTRCRNSAVAPIPDHARLTDRSWVFEYIALLEEKYREYVGQRDRTGRKLSCSPLTAGSV